MNGKLKVKQIEKPDGKPVDLTGQSAAKARINFDMTNGAIRDSLNVSSTTDIIVGKYAYAFTNAFSSSLRTVTMGVASGVTDVQGQLGDHVLGSTASVQHVLGLNAAGTSNADLTFVHNVAHGDLA
ncbi:hypothetical protein [Aestuariispira ectoiniformans]|uniref:hypothetical protein n=1 Tax=Aestuariispira ectoiniformans TaxID=2775080 RepID=UPI00223C4BC6|nr:hypothetical protein [Aestuariispira ectoiniformans]